MSEEVSRDRFILFKSHLDAYFMLPVEERHAYIKMLYDYAFYGKEPGNDSPFSIRLSFIQIKPTIDKTLKAYDDGKKGGRPSNKSATETMVKTPVETTVKTEEGEGEGEGEGKVEGEGEGKGEGEGEGKGVEKVHKKTKRFTPPSVSDVEAYAKSAGLNIDANKFVDHYAVIGWVVGRTEKKMSDWKAAVRNWCRNDKKWESDAGKACAEPTGKRGGMMV